MHQAVSALNFVLRSPMALARRVFQTSSRILLVDLLELLRTMIAHNALDVSLVNRNQETIASILGCSSVQHLDQHLTHLISLARLRPLPLTE